MQSLHIVQTWQMLIPFSSLPLFPTGQEPVRIYRNLRRKAWRPAGGLGQAAQRRNSSYQGGSSFHQGGAGAWNSSSPSPAFIHLARVCLSAFCKLTYVNVKANAALREGS
jgi:hypothetical protein